MRYALAIVSIMASLTGDARAQTTAPDPILRVAVDPPRVVVGQSATLRVEVLVPNFMTKPPELPDFQVRNAVTRQLRSLNINDQHDGNSYAGVRFEFAIYPQEPGSYAVGGQKITVHYAAEPPATRDAELELPRIEFAAFIPDAAAGLRPFVAASKLTVEQTVQRSSDQLKTGDSVTRTVTINAEETPAMLLPPQMFVAIDGLALYPAQPQLTDQRDGRTDLLKSTRADSATYMLQQPGDYVLPAIDVSWWNVSEQKIEHTHLEAVPLRVMGTPVQPVSGTAARWNWDRLVDLAADHWLLAIIVLVLFAGLAWIAPRAVTAIAARQRQRREAYLRSEAWSFDRFRNAVRAGRADAVYFTLLDWLQRFAPVAPEHSLASLKAAAQNLELDHEIAAIERQLFAPDHGTGNWSPAQLLRHVSPARRKLQRQAARRTTAPPLPERINPIGNGLASDQRRRPPAR